MSRFIDADLIEYEPMCRAMGNGMYEDCETADKDQIDDIPTADVRENVKARWIPHPDPTLREWDICTACGTGCKRREYGKNDDGIEWMTEYGFPYCPNCGADMRGEA